MKKFFTAVVLVGAVIVSGCGSRLVLEKPHALPTTTQNTLQATALETPPIPDTSRDTDDNAYQVLLFDTSGQRVEYLNRVTKAGTEYSVRKLVKTSVEGDPTILVDDLVALARSVSSSVNYPVAFTVLSVSSDGNYVFLQESDGLDGFNIPLPIWRYDVHNKTLVFLKNVSAFSTTAYRTHLSPDRLMLVSVPEDDSKSKTCLGDSRHLYLLTMMNDKAEVIVTLPKGETFNSRYCGYFGGGDEVEFPSNTEVTYTVFDQTKADKNYESKTTVVPKQTLRNELIQL